MPTKVYSPLGYMLHQIHQCWCAGMRLKKLTDMHMVVFISLAVAGVVLGARQMSLLEPLELTIFDQMMRLRADPGIDPRLLVVEVTEADIRLQKRWPIADQAIAQALEKLRRQQPNVIGLDILRDIPNQPGHDQLLAQLSKPNVIAITYLGNTPKESVPPPSSVPSDRIGFNDVLTDGDNVVRRNLMFVTDGATTFTSLATQLTLAYLAGACPQSTTQPKLPPNCHSIQPETTASGDLQLDKTVFTWLQSNSGGYQTIDAGGYQILLNYRSAENVAHRVTLTQVLTDQVDPRWVKGKIVLVGVTAPSGKDEFATPFSAAATGNRKMAGVLLHAQMVSQLLMAVFDRQPLFWFWSESVEILWIVGWTVLSGILAWLMRRTLVLGGISVMVLALIFALGFGIFSQQGWVPLASPALGAILAGSIVVVYRAQQSHRQQQMVMKLLGQNTSPEIATALWEGRDRLLSAGYLPGQTLTATMLFTDIHNFTSISEQLPPQIVMSWLNEFLTAMTQEVQAHQGITNKFTGDGLLAVFGVPVPRTTLAAITADARRAVTCALAMGDRITILNQQWQQRNLPTIQTRIGIFTGPVMVGSLGGKDRLEYGVIGDSVNIAARLENYAKDKQICTCRILIAGETWTHLQNDFTVEPWGMLPLKGKQHLVDVYRVIGYADTSGDRQNADR